MNYRVEYQYNGKPSYLEFFLFVNPLGEQCFKCEAELAESIKYISTPVDVNILTYVSSDNIMQLMEKLEIPKSNITERNFIYQKIYQAAIAFQAASMQGKKYGRKLLRLMQANVAGDYLKFNEGLLMDIACQIDLDMDTFTKDLHSDLAKQMFWRDIKVARQMNVNQTPSLVIFENIFTDTGYIMNDKITIESIFSFLDSMLEYHCLKNASLRTKSTNNSILNKQKFLLESLKNYSKQDFN